MTVEQVGLRHLNAPVELLIDQWGIPHIYAGSVRDAYIAQGFNAARDRMFQIDLWLRRGNGRLAEVFGASCVPQDVARRRLLYRGSEEDEWAAYPSTTRGAVEAFVAGYNDCVEQVLQGQRALPPEFVRGGYLPATWTPFELVRMRTHGLYFSVEQEWARATTLRDLGNDVEALRAIREPECDIDDLTDGLILRLPDHVLDEYRLAFSPASSPEFGDVGEGNQTGGSNNWVVSGSRTGTGRPVLANDPHRAMTLPSLRYLVHLNAPGLVVAGAGEPGLPGVSIGHNECVAFGLTIWPADQEDLYVYELNPEDPSCYRWGDGWESFRAERDVVEVRNAEPVTADLRFTRHGPVIWCDSELGLAVAVRAAWLEPGGAPYLASLGYQGAATVDEFRSSLEVWSTPPTNHVFADVAGDIGWQTAANVHRRSGWNGSSPVRGDGAFEWQGRVPGDELPGTRNPRAGFCTTSNEYNVPAVYGDLFGVDWFSPARHERLVSLLRADHTHTVADALELQDDAVSPRASGLIRQLCSHVRGTLPAELRQLAAWDGEYACDRREPLLFEIWVRRHLRPALQRVVLESLRMSPVAAERAMRNLQRDESVSSDLRLDELLVRRCVELGVAPRLDGVIRDTLHRAAAELSEMRDVSGEVVRNWGDAHVTDLQHPFFSDSSGVPESWRRLGPVARPGSADTVGMVAHTPDFVQTVGASFRIVMDVGEWDRCRVTNAPGQSGDPESPHYADLLTGLSASEAVPLYWTRAAVESATERRILLVPKV